MGQEVPLSIAVAPFPEGFQGDLDEHAQQLVQLMEASIQGNFLTGLVLPPGSTLPTSDQGPIAMGNVWYFWDPATNQYLPQTVSSKLAKNFAKNCCYQIQQTGSAITPGVGVTAAYDMSECRSTLGNVLAIALDTGPPASTDTDYIPSSIKYTVGPALVPTPGATDLYSHEHLFEGSDIAMLQGEILTLSFSVWVNVPGNYSVYLTSGGRDCSYVSTFAVTAASVWQRIKILNIPAIPVGTGTWHFGEGQTGLYVGIPMLVGTQWQTTIPTTTPNTWKPAFLAGTSGNQNLLTVVNNQIKITGIKLEASPVASFLSVPSFDADLWDAIRYYFTTFNYQSVTAGVAMNLGAPADGLWSGAMLFPRRMAKVPSVVPFGYSSHVTGQITDISASVDIPVATLAATPKGICDSQSAVISTTGTVAAITMTGTVTNGSNIVTAITSTASLSAGMSVAGPGIAPNTFIDVISSGTVIVLSKVPSGSGTGATLTFGTFSITAIPSTTGMRVGQPISGAGIPAGTTIASIVSGTAITISAPAIAFGTGVALTVRLLTKADVLWALITADARLT